MNSKIGGSKFLQLKIHHGTETKKFKLASCLLEDLIEAVRGLTWMAPLPDRFKFYYFDAEVLCTVDDQNSFNRAIEFDLKQNKKTTLKLILAQTHLDAARVSQLVESMKIDASTIITNSSQARIDTEMNEQPQKELKVPPLDFKALP